MRRNSTTALSGRVAALVAAALAPLALTGLGPAADDADVAARDGGSQIAPSVYECTSGHRVETHLITLESGAARYTFRYSGCIDPSHGDLRPSAEGNFGMPDPTPANWYWGGFLQVLVNGTDAVQYRVTDMRVTEAGARGALQVIWAHPDADVRLRLMLLPGSNHVLALLTWTPRAGATIKTLAVRLRCYPSFFTAARHRQGERHCQTPRTDEREPNVLELQPAQDIYLCYYDAVFDVARGEGDGPCAVVVAPDAVAGGRVQIGDYAVMTDLDLKPEAGQTRFALYDFTGLKNAEAEAYLKGHAAEDLAQLTATDFRPEPVRRLDATQLGSECARLLAEAGDDGQTLRPKVDEVLSRVAALKGKADQGDWVAEAELADVLQKSTDLFWKLKAFAILNSP